MLFSYIFSLYCCCFCGSRPPHTQLNLGQWDQSVSPSPPILSFLPHHKDHHQKYDNWSHHHRRDRHRGHYYQHLGQWDQSVPSAPLSSTPIISNSLSSSAKLLFEKKFRSINMIKKWLHAPMKTTTIIGDERGDSTIADSDRSDSG